MMRVRLLGGLEVALAGGAVLGPRDFGGAKPKQIFEILVLGRGRPVSKDRLAELLWGDDPPRNVAATLETYVSVLRRQLGEEARDRLTTEPGGYCLGTSGEWSVDTDELDALLSEADAARRAAGSYGPLPIRGPARIGPKRSTSSRTRHVCPTPSKRLRIIPCPCASTAWTCSGGAAARLVRSSDCGRS